MVRSMQTDGLVRACDALVHFCMPGFAYIQQVHARLCICLHKSEWWSLQLVPAVPLARAGDLRGSLTFLQYITQLTVAGLDSLPLKAVLCWQFYSTPNQKLPG
jgi:hypothetical protein